MLVRVSAAAVTIRQCAEGLSVRVGADHFLVRHHPGSGVIHLGTEEQTVKHADTPRHRFKSKAEADTLCSLPLFLFFILFYSEVTFSLAGLMSYIMDFIRVKELLG